MDKENQIIIAKKYATAFINVFFKDLSIEECDKLQNLEKYLKSYPYLVDIELKLLNEDKQSEMLNKIFDNFKLNKAFSKLITLLTQDKRLFLLSDIINYIIRLYKEEVNLEDFKIFSSHELSESQKNDLIDFLKRKTYKNIRVTIKLDPNLIAGIKAVSDNYEWEYSIRQKLNLLGQA